MPARTETDRARTPESHDGSDPPAAHIVAKPPQRIAATPGLGTMFRQSAVALTIDGEPTEDEWLAAGKAILQTTRNQLWWLGDWWVFGSHAYGQRSKSLRDAELCRHYQTFANAGRISRKFETYRRREDLTWYHHSVVAALGVDDQEFFLNLASREELSAAAIRDAIKADKLHRSPAQNTDRRQRRIGHWRRECLAQTADAIVDACDKLTAQIIEGQNTEFLEQARKVTDACVLLINAAFGDDPTPERIHELCAVMQCGWSDNECAKRQRVGLSRIRFRDAAFDFAGRITSRSQMKAQDNRTGGSIE